MDTNALDKEKRGEIIKTFLKIKYVKRKLKIEGVVPFHKRL
jgi:hypothetical protein